MSFFDDGPPETFDELKTQDHGQAFPPVEDEHDQAERDQPIVYGPQTKTEADAHAEYEAQTEAQADAHAEYEAQTEAHPDAQAEYGAQTEYDPEAVYDYEYEPEDAPRERPRPVRVRLSEFRERITKALAGLDRGRLDQLTLDPSHAQAHQVIDDLHDLADARPAQGPEGTSGRFATQGRQGTSGRGAVDSRIADLEAELEELRRSQPPISINEEIERLGEQTASILVVAHDQAHETKQRAQEQAERCVADAAANAVAITEKAKRDLTELDSETDTVWRDRARLIDDARNVGAALIALADEAAERFPEDKPAEVQSS